jgi:hypothetical protein
MKPFTMLTISKLVAQAVSGPIVSSFFSVQEPTEHCSLYGHLTHSATSLSCVASLLVFFLFLFCPTPPPPCLNPTAALLLLPQDHKAVTMLTISTLVAQAVSGPAVRLQHGSQRVAHSIVLPFFFCAVTG